MRHLGILAHSTEGAALCFLAFCQEGFRELGVRQHPDVTMDCIAMGRSMPAWEAGEHQSIRATLAESAERLARAGAGFFVCPDNTAHMALALLGVRWRCPAFTSPRSPAHRPPATAVPGSASWVPATPWKARSIRASLPPTGSALRPPAPATG